MIGRTYICLLTACLLLNVPSAFAAKILIINSYHPENIWTMNCLQGVSDTLGNQHDIEILYMNTKRKPKAEFNQIAKDTLEQAEKINPDLIMLADDNALSLLGQDLSKKDIPIVFYGINNNPRVYFKPERLPNNVFGVLERHLILPLVRHIKNIAPIKHNRILVLLDDSTTSQSIKAVGLKGDDQNIVGDTEVNAQTVRYFDDWKQHVLQAGESYDAIILQTWYTVLDRKSGQVINEKEVLDWTGKNTTVPLFSSVSYAVGNDKAVGAFVLSAYGHGKEAANSAITLLNGDKPKKFKTSKSGIFYLNKRGLDKFNLTVPHKIRNHATYK